MRPSGLDGDLDSHPQLEGLGEVVGTPAAPSIFLGLGPSFSEARATSLNGPAMSFSQWGRHGQMRSG